MNIKFLREQVRIPVPPPEVQKQIIDECAEVEEEYRVTRMSVESYQKRIEEIFDKQEVISKRGGTE